MNQPVSGPGLLRDYIRTIFRHKGKLLLYNLLVLGLAVTAIFVWPREYRSEAKVWIKIGRENSKLDPTAATGQRIAIQESDREDEIKSVIDILGSRGVVERAVTEVGPMVVLGEEPLPGTEAVSGKNQITEAIKDAAKNVISLVKQIDPVSEHEQAVQEVLKHMDVSAERKSNVVSVQYDTDSPHLAQAVVNSIIEQYKHEHSRIHKTEGSKKFFGDQLETLKNRVDESSDELRSTKNASGLASVDGHRNYLEQQIVEIGSARLVAEQKLSEANAMLVELNKQIEARPETILSEEKSVPNTGRDTLRAQLQEVQIKRAGLESKQRYHPELKAIIKQEAKLKKELEAQTSKDRKEKTQAINVVHQELTLEHAKVKSQVEGFAATIDRLAEQEKQTKNEIAKLNQAEIDIKQREREVQLAVKSYMSYAENMEDARIDEALDESAISNVSIAQAPTLEEKPVSPSKLIVLALALAAMMFGSLGIVASMLVFDDSVNRQEAVEEVLDVPVIISVPNQREYRHVLH